MENSSSNFTREEKRLAKKIRGIIKDPNHTIAQIEQAIPFKDEIVGTLNCLASMLKEEVDKDKRLSDDFRQYLREAAQILNDCLKDNHITENERIKIIETLNDYGKHYASVEQERERQSGKNKRFFGGALTTLSLAALISILFKKRN